MSPQEYEGTLIAKKKLTADISLFTIKLQDNNFTFPPGQFMMLSLMQDRGLARAFSICSDPAKKNQLEFCMKIRDGGVLSEKVEQAPLNTKIYLKGPFGSFMLKPTSKEIVFIAGGTGIAPIRSMLYALLEQKANNNIWLFYRFKTEEEYIFKEELEALQKNHKNLRLIPSVSNHNSSWNHETDRIHNIIAKYIKDPSKVECYICGPPSMVKDTLEVLPKLGFAPESLHKEAW